MYLKENVLAIVETESYYCSLQKYMKSHSLMLIEINNSTQKLYLTFETVLFYDGPLSWTGANICIAEMDELGNRLNSISSPVELHQRFKLFVFDNSDYKIKIIAENILLSDNIPPNFPTSE